MTGLGTDFDAGWPKMDFGDRSDNPFSVALQSPSRRRRPALQSALRIFLLACVGLAISVVLSNQSQRWLLHRLTHDLDSLPAAEKQARLTEIAALGPEATPVLTQSMLKDPDDVARTANALLEKAQNSWSLLEPDDRERRHLALVKALADIALELPEDRTGWASSLLQQTLMTTVDRPQKASRELHHEASRVLEMLSLSNRTSSTRIDSLAADAEADSDASNDSALPRRLAVKATPLPVDHSRTAELWTQWPPPNEMRSEAMVVRTDARLQPVETSENVQLKPISEPAAQHAALVTVEDPIETPSATELTSGSPTETLPPAEVQTTTLLVESPLETYDDPSVMRWLASEHAALREKAAAELSRRGYGPADLTLARQLVSGETATRLELVNQLARQSDRDPRPWLLLLLKDASRDVRLRTVTTLATMNDPSILQQLNQHLVDEQDPTVAARIRRVLKLR